MNMKLLVLWIKLSELIISNADSMETDNMDVCVTNVDEEQQMIYPAKIDIDSFVNGDTDVRMNIVNTLNNSFNTFGIVSLINHGIHSNYVKEAYAGGKNFFYRQESYKAQYPFSGWKQGGFFNLTSKEQGQLFNLNLKYDENFNANARNKNFANLDMVKASLNLAKQYRQLTKVIHEIVSTALEIDDQNYFDNLHQNQDEMYNFITYFYYKQNPILTKKRIQAHGDFGTFTISLSDSPGLQIYFNNTFYNIYKDSNYENELYLWLGYTIPVLTNNVWKETIHRVVPMETDLSERMTMTYFVGPDYDQTVDVISDCKPCNKQPKQYQPTTVLQIVGSKKDQYWSHEYKRNKNT
eukprot:96402_1